MRIEIFSDVVCPWCAVGKRRLERALERFSHVDEVEVVWRAFELDPQAPVRRTAGDSAQRLATKYGMSREEALSVHAQLTATAAAEGLDVHFDRVQPGNTFDAHRLLHLAGEQGAALQDALKERLFLAYFSEGAAIGEPETLVRLAAEVGLDAGECSELLAGDRYADEVRADEQDARRLGVTGVPFFVVDSTFGIAGAQDPQVILEVLEEAWARGHAPQLPMVPVGSPGSDSASCGDESCAI